MCKLCNTDRPPIVSPRKNLLINETIKEYIGEYSCRRCVKFCSVVLKTGPDKSIDYWVMQRIFYNHYKTLGNNREELRKYKRASYLKNYNKSNIKIRTILGISVRENIATNHTIYVVSVEINGKNTRIGTYNTFDEAMATKIKYMVENNQSHALKVLKTKLKELQNENN
jgi:hypothetical protein